MVEEVLLLEGGARVGQRRRVGAQVAQRHAIRADAGPRRTTVPQGGRVHLGHHLLTGVMLRMRVRPRAQLAPRSPVLFLAVQQRGRPGATQSLLNL